MQVRTPSVTDMNDIQVALSEHEEGNSTQVWMTFVMVEHDERVSIPLFSLIGLGQDVPWR